MNKPNNEQLLDHMEIIKDRHGLKATVIASQIPVSDWYDCLETNTTAADAILDRRIHSAIRFELSNLQKTTWQSCLVFSASSPIEFGRVARYTPSLYEKNKLKNPRAIFINFFYGY